MKVDFDEIGFFDESGFDELVFYPAHLVLFHSCFRQCCHHKLASSCSHASDSEPLPRTGIGRFFVSLDFHAESELCFCLECGQQGFAPNCTKVCWNWRTLQCDWRQTCSCRGFRLTRSVVLPFVSRACRVLTMTRRFQRTHPLRGMETSSSSSNDFGMGIVDPVLTCGFALRMDVVNSKVVDPARTGRVLDGGSHEVRSPDGWSVGDTDDNHSLTNDVVIICHTLISAELWHIRTVFCIHQFVVNISFVLLRSAPVCKSLMCFFFHFRCSDPVGCCRGSKSQRLL